MSRVFYLSRILEASVLWPGVDFGRVVSHSGLGIGDGSFRLKWCRNVHKNHNQSHFAGKSGVQLNMINDGAVERELLVSAPDPFSLKRLRLQLVGSCEHSRYNSPVRPGAVGQNFTTTPVKSSTFGHLQHWQQAVFLLLIFHRSRPPVDNENQRITITVINNI